VRVSATAVRTTPIYCYDGALGDRYGHLGDPHAVKLLLDSDDWRKYQAQRREDVESGLSPTAIGQFVAVIDAETGDRWEVATAPCGLGCHCAAIARRAGE